MKIKMAGTTATKFKKNDTAHQLAVAIYLSSQVYIMKLSTC